MLICIIVFAELPKADTVDAIESLLPGGGGFGDLKERDPALKVQDNLAGLVSK